jgi:putative glutathione S-transferase
VGILVEGRWTRRGYDTARHGGRFVRDASVFRRWVTADGAPGPGGEGGFAAERGRYHLYVSYACPWAHRTLIARALKGLGDAISVDVVHWHMGDDGWTFATGEGATGDSLHGADVLHRVYTRARADYTGRVTVPVLWDRARDTIVSNESSEILRMLNDAFAGCGARGPDLYPAAARARIDAVNARVYDTVNNGVYRAGFATSQRAYEEAFDALFESLDWLDAELARRRFLAADWPTEADWRLFTTLVRFDAVYHGHFKCNLRRIVDYPALSGYLRDLYQHPGIRETVHFDHIKRHYYESHRGVNPTGIVPKGPALDLDAPHGRDAP